MEGDEGQVNVAKYVIKKTPIGHITKSLQNLNKVLGEKVMDCEEVHKEIHKYGETHLSQVQNDVTNTKVVISGLVKDAEGFYHDQGQKVKFKIGESGNIEEAQTEEYANELRDAVETQLKKYLEENYNENVTKYNVYVDEAANKLVILISAHNLNFKSFWTGEWLSTWEVDLSSNTVKGSIKANTYYYEEGNIQFSLDNNVNGTAQGGDSASLAKSMIDVIKTNENNIQKELDSIYEQLSSDYIKVLRRKQLVTGSKFNWNVNQVRIGESK